MSCDNQTESTPEVVEAAFSDLPLRPEVLQAVQKAGYTVPTEIQMQIVPFMHEGRDVLAQSQTGTGKTAAFALPILSRIDVERRVTQVLVLAPTRELAIQVAKSFSDYGRNLPGLSVAAIYGGQDYEVQFRALNRGPQIIVGTPGRTIDHLRRKTIDLSNVECLVLDEADEMLNMGFLEDVEHVIEQTPETRQIALFSATLPHAIQNIAQRYLKDPVKLTVEAKTVTADSIRQRALFVGERDKMDALTRFLESEESDGVIVFTRTKDSTVVVAEELRRRGLSAIALNGDMPQKVRERTIEQLKAGHLDILVATDVAARGLDVTRVSHVFNYDAPHDAQAYIHRVGRTGRAGRPGEAIIFVTNGQRGKLRIIERATKQPLEIVGMPTNEQINQMRVTRFKKSIADATDAHDLGSLERMIESYAEESGQSATLIAAALVQLAQNGRPFFLRAQPPRQRPSRDERSGGGYAKKPYEKRSRDERPYERKPRETRVTPPAAAPTETAAPTNGQLPEQKPYEQKPYEKKLFEKKPYEKKSVEAKSYEKKPYEKKSYEKKPYEAKSYEKKPYEAKSYEKKPYEAKSYEKKPYETKSSHDRRDDVEAPSRPVRRDFDANEERPQRAPGSRRRLGPPEPGMNRYRIEVGAQDGVAPGNIVGAIANEGGIDGKTIGPITIHDSHSTIDLPKHMPSETYQALRHTWVNGKQLRLTRAVETNDEARPRSAKGPRRDRPTDGRMPPKARKPNQKFKHRKGKNA